MTTEDKEGLESLMQYTLRKITILKKRIQRLNNKEETKTEQTESWEFIVNIIDRLQREIRIYTENEKKEETSN